MRKRTMILATALLAIPLTAASAAPTGRAAPSVTQFNGTWSVSIVTDSGSCDRGYRYALRIADGRIYYDNPSFNLNGHVNSRGQARVTVRAGGQVSVTVVAGGQGALGTGRLSRDYGEGTWIGRSASDQCSGHWEAERR